MPVIFTIIIPVKQINAYVRETIPHLLQLDNKAWEVYIVTNDDEKNEWFDERIKLISSGRVSPARKRDLGAACANGEFLVFLDDDSYPNRDYLDIAYEYLTNSNITSLGGPAVTPSSDSILQKVSGSVFISKFSGGAPERYVPYGKEKFVNDWPSVNLIVRKTQFLEIGGFDSDFWPGEDTLFCLKLVKSGYKILYIPRLIVWHHRRSSLSNHVKQVFNYGQHRGYFVQKLDATSLKFTYFLPSLFVGFIILSGIVWLYEANYYINEIVYLGWILYISALCLALISIKKYHEWLVVIIAPVYILLTHISYGLGFVNGLFFKRNLVSKLR